MHYGQIAWWAANLPHGETEVRLWHDDGGLVGWGWVTGGTELEFDVRPSHRHLLDEILEWAQPEELVVRSDHEDAIARIEAHGLVHDPTAPWIRVNARSLEQIDEPRVPDGYRVRTVEERDWSSRVEAHRSAFQPSRFSDDVYAFVRATAAYRADLDCVVEAPDGSIAAYTLAWFDEVNARRRARAGRDACRPSPARSRPGGRPLCAAAAARARRDLRARRVPRRRGVSDPRQALRVDRLSRDLAEHRLPPPGLGNPKLADS